MARKGKVFAIIGDPNTGKSVLTYLLFDELKKRGESVFRQEGDPAAPTPPWYLEACNETVHDIRRKLKTGWCMKAAKWVRDSLHGLKKTFDIVLVDLGGGRPPEERVTSELEEILKEVDYAILLCPDVECFRGWKKELSEKAPHVQIFRECLSILNEESMVNSECVLGSLYRSVATSPPEHLEKAVKKLADEIVDIAKSGD